MDKAWTTPPAPCHARMPAAMDISVQASRRVRCRAGVPMSRSWTVARRSGRCARVAVTEHRPFRRRHRRTTFGSPHEPDLPAWKGAMFSVPGFRDGSASVELGDVRGTVLERLAGRLRHSARYDVHRGRTLTYLDVCEPGRIASGQASQVFKASPSASASGANCVSN